MSESSFSERKPGPTPNGGAYSVAYYFDEAEEPTTRAKAVLVEIIEFDARGQQVHSTWGSLNGQPFPE